jgi:outer membrane autotransporter protein
LIEGSIDGGSGTDVVTLQGQDHADNNFLGFETLIMNGQDWSLSGTNTFSNGVDIQRGRLAVNGAITSPLFTVQDAGILGGNGSLTGNVTSTGTIAPGNSVGTLTINGNFTQTGGGFDTQFDQHGIDKLNVIGGTATLSGAPRLRVSPIGGAAGANGVILHADNGITGSFGSVAFQGNGAATLIQTANDISLTTIDGTAIEGTAFAASQAGLDYLDAVDAELAAGLDGCGDDSCARDAAKKHLWAKAFGRFGSEAAQDGNRPFDYRIAGSAIGADMPVAPGLRLGGSFGYSNTDETLTHDAASADINTTQAALYAKYQTGRFFVTGELAGGWQHLDLSRNLGGSQSADANTNGWLFGSSLQAGATFAFPHGWRLTPSLGAAYQHQWVDGYGEHNGGAGNTSIASHQSDALRLRAQLLLRQDYQLSDMTLTPHIKVGAMRELNLGGHADGSFAVDGSDFTVSLNDTSRTIGLVGLGLQVGFANGLTTYVDYDAALSRQGDVHSITGGLRYDW